MSKLKHTQHYQCSFELCLNQEIGERQAMSYNPRRGSDMAPQSLREGYEGLRGEVEG